MVERVSVQNFRSLESVELNLGQVNVFIGANGSGKSNVLEALGLIGAAAGGRMDAAAMLRRGMRPAGVSILCSAFDEAGSEKYLSVRSSFKDSDYTFSSKLDKKHNNIIVYDVEVLNERSSDRMTVKNLVYRVPDDSLLSADIKGIDRTSGVAALKAVEIDPASTTGQLLRTLRDYVIYTPQTPVLRGLVPDAQQIAPVGLSGGRLSDAVREVFRQRSRFVRSVREDVLELIGWAGSFKVVPVSSTSLSSAVPSTANVIEFTDRFMAEGRNRLTAHDVSEGALFVLFAAVLCTHPEAPRTFAIDNADHGLNPRLARALMERICRWTIKNPDPRQVLLTTHNPAVLDGLPLQDDRVRLFAVDRDIRGRTVVNRVRVTEELLAKAKEGWTLSRMWMTGLIGGVPDV